MRVVDTSVWIEWLISSKTGNLLESEMPDMDRCAVPTIVQMELAKWVTREMSMEVSSSVIAHTERCIIVPLDTPIAITAAEIAREYKLATADAIIYATALAINADLLTCDAHFDGLPRVKFIQKIPA